MNIYKYKEMSFQISIFKIWRKIYSREEVYLGMFKMTLSRNVDCFFIFPLWTWHLHSTPDNQVQGHFDNCISEKCITVLLSIGWIHSAFVNQHANANLLASSFLKKTWKVEIAAAPPERGNGTTNLHMQARPAEAS